MQRRLLSVHWSVAVVAVLVLSLVIAACSGGDDEDPTATTAAAEVTQTPAGVSRSTPTEDAEPTATTAATATRSDATSTTVATATKAATATSATTATTAATATSAATATPADTSDDLGDIETLDPELLPNYSLRMQMQMEGIPSEEDLGDVPLTFSLDVQQSELDNYYMRFDSEDMALEVWLVGDTTYLTQEDGSIVSVPGSEMAGVFSPSLFLQTAPSFESDLQAERQGEETVSGRQTTKYSIDAESYLEASELFPEGEVPDDATGDFEIWVDNELNIPIRYEADITWTNSDETDGVIVANYLISEIGSTARVEPPQ